MSKNKSKIYELDTIRFRRYTAESIKCKNCGHSILFEGNRKICTYCGHWVYKNDKVEFEYNLKKILKNY